MELYKVKITLQSSFMTILRGDTLFGHLCWALRYVEGEIALEGLLEGYTQGRPFAVVSDAFPSEWLPKPHLPMKLLGENPEKKKENRKQRWLTADDLAVGRFSNAVDDKKAGLEKKPALEIHNAINYRTSRTGEGFDPYASLLHSYAKSMTFYVLINTDRIDIERIERAFVWVGASGYGKKATVGKGRFVVESMEAVALSSRGKAFMTLSPCVLEGLEATACFYDTFVRFGKHGASLAKQKAFKKPLLMADTSAVVVFDEEKELPFIGKGVDGISAIHPKTVHQGYAITVATGVDDAKL